MMCYSVGKCEYEFMSIGGGGHLGVEGNNLLTVFHLIKVGILVNLNCGCFLNSFSGSFHLKQYIVVPV